ncbi:MAG: tetratricopeptide repeat protein [Acidobacteriota bacterium]
MSRLSLAMMCLALLAMAGCESKAETAVLGGAVGVGAAEAESTLPPRSGLSSPQPAAVSTRSASVMEKGFSSPQKLYTQAVNSVMEGKYDLASRGFTRYLTLFPGTLLEERAHFWLAETHYGQGAFIEAIRRYDVVIGKYPESAKVPAAYLKKAYAFMEIAEESVVLGTLKELRKRFPNTREARLAVPAILELE